MKRFSDFFKLPRRIGLFEFHDLEWVPEWIHESFRLVDNYMNEAFECDEVFAPLLSRSLIEFNDTSVVDLASGAGGVIPILQKRLRMDYQLDPQFTLTDMFPPLIAVQKDFEQKFEKITYDPRPINAGDLPEDLGGTRTIFNSFHHFSPSTARAVLRDAYQKKHPIVVGEFAENNLLACVGALFTFFFSWYVLAFKVPRNNKRTLFGILLPVIPLMHCFDAIASVFRNYPLGELKELTQGMTEDYSWEIGTMHVPHMWTPGVYLLGLPSRSGA